ncbi:hypothetical protein ASG01_10225 [Chryseobacterium sp. Leaf180]|uniref:glycosyltransferase family 2 protein n=1 Tax=Chryseobacterium sp. Leaf180 TaxID=1736289 RepID=UPI000700A2E7|nr:glycosyltransferase [Chryseobacterium sp. Leaf180]KQR93540.1 hypothetical protein ASG01_10225 [Chryseobacterium sp. Leaf180]
MIELSIIVPTVGRTEDMSALLLSLTQGLDNIKHEILIVDQNNDNRLDNVISKFSVYLKIKHYKVNFKGLSKAKNFGISKAKGSYISCPDDDCKVTPETYRKALDLIKTSGFNAVFGKCIDNSGNDSVIRFNKKSFELSPATMNGGFVEATMLASSEIFKDFQFDEHMGAGMYYGSEEGYDWLYRILNSKKFRVIYSPEIIFYHPQTILEKGDEQSLKRAYSYACGTAFLCKKHKFVSKFLKKISISVIGIIIHIFHKPKHSKFYVAQLKGLVEGFLSAKPQI